MKKKETFLNNYIKILKPWTTAPDECEIQKNDYKMPSLKKMPNFRPELMLRGNTKLGRC